MKRAKSRPRFEARREDNSAKQWARSARACKRCGRVLEHDDELEYRTCDGCQSAEYSEALAETLIERERPDRWDAR